LLRAPRSRLLAVAAFAAAVVLSVAAPPGRAAAPAGAAQVAAMLRGVPQHGVDLGSPKAPVTLYEFADLQCPYCAQWERNTLPVLVRKYVRPGKLRIVFVGMTFLGPDSTKAFRAALAAGQQNRFWNVAELFYVNQRTENTGWVTDPFVRSVGSAVSGLKVAKMLAARTSAGVEAQLAAAANLAKATGIDRTPSFAAGRTNAAPKPVQITSLDATGIEPMLDALLAG
jgi:protein-disulfide isomerase